MRKIILLVIITIFAAKDVSSEYKNRIVVDQSGHGDYTTLTEAINSMAMFNYQRITVFIKNGTYEEKIRFDQDYVTLEGEDRDSTIIKFNLLRENWINNKDSIGPAVININGDDIIFKNLTVINTQPEIGPHAFALYGTGTRTILLNCSFISKGGDTVSLWDYKTGMYYHADCYFEGAVDFVCPRGWCFIKDSKFYEVKNTAAIWHAGGYDKDQKFVLKNCSFDGVDGFQLGRHHYEAQFYLLDCSFSCSMSDTPIYRVTYEDTTRNRPFNWGERYYFNNSEKEGKMFEWLNDNFDEEVLFQISPSWTFDDKWDPESTTGPHVIDFVIYKNEVIIKFNENVSVFGQPVLSSTSGLELHYVSGAGSNTLKFVSVRNIEKQDVKGMKIINDSEIIGNIASVVDRQTDFIITKNKF